MLISSTCDSSMRWPSARISGRPARVFSSSTISTACAWCPIIPCMNSTSAVVNLTLERSTARTASMFWLGCPGAPGWTMGAAGVAGGALWQPEKTRQTAEAAARAQRPTIRMSVFDQAYRESPFPSVTTQALPLATFLNSSVRPLGQVTTTRSTTSRVPTPKVTGSSDCDR